MSLHPDRHLTGVFEMEALLQYPEAGPTVFVQANHFAINDTGSRQTVPQRSNHVGELEVL
jgi:hypothetical protein